METLEQRQENAWNTAGHVVRAYMRMESLPTVLSVHVQAPALDEYDNRRLSTQSATCWDAVTDIARELLRRKRLCARKVRKILRNSLHDRRPGDRGHQVELTRENVTTLLNWWAEADELRLAWSEADNAYRA